MAKFLIMKYERKSNVFVPKDDDFGRFMRKGVVSTVILNLF